MEVRKIGPEHARALGRLEAKIYPPKFCLGWQDFESDMTEAEARNGNLSFGIFKGSEIVGYTVAYIEDGEIYVSDLAILPNHRADRNLAALLAAFFQAAAEFRLPIKAECRECSYRVCINHPRFFRKFGYALTEHGPSTFWNGEPNWEVRFDYVG